MILCALLGTLLNAQSVPGATVPRRPRGIYAVVNITEEIKQQQKTNPSITPSQLHAYFQGLFRDLLGNPAVSGLTLQAHWDTLNPRPSSDPEPYDWSYLDDAFQVVSLRNARDLVKPAARTIQLIVTPGFQTPAWVLDQIPSCDGLFQMPRQTPPSSCGKATFVGFIEDGDGTELPMPWNAVYKAAWKTFLAALAAQYGSNPALVSIAVAGPTASTAEMILPHNGNTPTQPGGISVNDMWTQLLAFAYPADPAYQSSDQAFIDEWNAAIDAYGQIFSGVTLVATTGDGLPNLRGTGFTIPSAFSADCAKNPDRDCAAETTILSHFVDPAVGGTNAKATQWSGMEASRVGLDLAIDGVKRLSQSTARFTAPSSQILGGLQFNSPFSTLTLQEGCTSAFPPNATDTPPACSIPPSCTETACLPVACIPQACLAPGVTPADLTSYKKFSDVPPGDLIPPEQALYNVLKVYFDGTPAALFFGGTPGSAPLNYLQIYAADIQYAESHAGAPARVVKTDGASVLLSAEDLLDLASVQLLGIAEPPVGRVPRVVKGRGPT
jgi:hypothetical protein